MADYTSDPSFTPQATELQRESADLRRRARLLREQTARARQRFEAAQTRMAQLKELLPRMK
jgi:hypothetical protein